jgi:hypothetical protein
MHTCASTYILAVIVIYILFVVLYMGTRVLRLKRKLAAQGWKLYSKTGCSWCAKQQHLLRGYAATTYCDAPGQCPADITSFPTWVNHNIDDGSGRFVTAKILGYQTLDKLEGLLV